MDPMLLQLGSVEQIGWLQNPVPLWAFLIALLTAPQKWSEYVKEYVSERLGGMDNASNSSSK